MIEIDKIYNEDCLITLSRLEDNSIDLIITSPPYNKNAHASASGGGDVWQNLRGRQIPYDVYNDNMPQEEYEQWQRNIIRECVRVLKPNGSLFYNHKDIIVDGLIIPPKWVYDFKIHQQIIWKRNGTPALDPHYFYPITEYLYWIVKDEKKVFFDRSKAAFKNNVWEISFETNTNHPAPFPKNLVGNIILSCSQEGGGNLRPLYGKRNNGFDGDKV